MATKPSLDEDRRGDLRRYLIKCVAQNLISRDELKKPLSVLSRLGATLLADIAAIGGGAKDDLGAVASETAGRFFMELAARMGKR